jgi:DNA-binding NarL/FixJ family response regulator
VQGHPSPTLDRAPRPSGPLRIALANDYDVVVAGMAAMLVPYASRIDVVDVAVRRPTRETPIDIALFDTFGRPGPEPHRVLELIKQPNVEHVAIYSFSVDEAQVAEALSLGAHGYLWKGLPAAELVDALERVASGEVVVTPVRSGLPKREVQPDWPGRHIGLSRRESETLALLIYGLSNREIGDALHLGTETIKTHVRSLCRKLGVSNRVQAVAWALQSPDFSRSARFG